MNISSAVQEGCVFRVKSSIGHRKAIEHLHVIAELRSASNEELAPVTIGSTDAKSFANNNSYIAVKVRRTVETAVDCQRIPRLGGSGRTSDHASSVDIETRVRLLG